MKRKPRLGVIRHIRSYILVASLFLTSCSFPLGYKPDRRFVGVNPYNKKVMVKIPEESLPSQFRWNPGSWADPCKTEGIVPCFGCTWDDIFNQVDSVVLWYMFYRDSSSQQSVTLTKAKLDSLSWRFVFYEGVESDKIPASVAACDSK